MSAASEVRNGWLTGLARGRSRVRHLNKRENLRGESGRVRIAITSCHGSAGRKTNRMEGQTVWDFESTPTLVQSTRRGTWRILRSDCRSRCNGCLPVCESPVQRMMLRALRSPRVFALRSVGSPRRLATQTTVSRCCRSLKAHSTKRVTCSFACANSRFSRPMAPWVVASAPRLRASFGTLHQKSPASPR